MGQRHVGAGFLGFSVGLHSNVSQLGTIPPPPTPGHLAMSGNSLVDALGRGVLPASNG